LHGEQNEEEEEEEVEKNTMNVTFFFCTDFGEIQIEMWDIIIISV